MNHSGRTSGGRKLSSGVLPLFVCMILTCSLWPFTATAQLIEPEPRKHFSIMGGLSVPMGDFGSTTSNDRGFAQVGLALLGDYNYEVVRHLDLGVMTSLNLNELNHDELQRQFQKTFSGGTVTSGFWYMANVVGSTGFSISSSPALNFYGRFYSGVMIATIPEIKISVPGATAKQSSETAAVFTYGFGTGVNIKNKVAFGLRYLTGNPDYDVTFTVMQAYDGSTSSQKSNWEQPTSMLHVVIGYIF